MADAKEGPVQLSNGTIIGSLWKVTSKIGEGECGAVYKVEHINTKLNAAMKVENNRVASGRVLKLEAMVLRKLKGKPNVCQLLYSGKKEEFSYIVMTLLGDSLSRLTRKCGKELTVSTQIRVGINVLYGLKQIHDAGFVHRDLKPANLAIGAPGTSSNRFIHVLDFGLSREFTTTTTEGKTEMRPPRPRCLFRGTANYCSMNTHDKQEQARVDDLWSLLYVIAELRGPLPWYDCRSYEVAEVKRIAPDKILLYNSPVQLLDFAEHLRTLTHYSRPDYRKLFDLLNDVMDDGDFKFTDPWDWEKKGTIASIMQSPQKTTTTSIGSPKEGKQPNAASQDPLGIAVKPTKSLECVGTVENMPESNQREPAVRDVNNPFPAEDFNTNPLGF